MIRLQRNIFLINIFIDRRHNDGSIAPTRWRQVELALLDVVLKVMYSNPRPSLICDDAGTY